MATPPRADDQRALLLLLAVIHGLARFVALPEGRADVDLVAREWDRPADGPAVETAEQLSR